MMKKEVLQASSLSREELLQKNPMEKKKTFTNIDIECKGNPQRFTNFTYI